MENLDPLSPPKSRMGKWRVFALRAPSSLIWGGGWGFAVPFYFVQDCNLRQNKMENLDPPSPPNQGWENGAFLPFARLHPWFGGDGGLLFHFILSKIVAQSWLSGLYTTQILLENARHLKTKKNLYGDKAKYSVRTRFGCSAKLQV